MTRKRDWRWVSRDEGDDGLAIWTGCSRPKLEEGLPGSWHFESTGGYLRWAKATEFAALGARIRPGECRRVRIKLEVLPDE